ncbi:MAG: tetratricopeptide repeat protein [Flavobacteriaceae bacterium]|nr:tetratricopeptide repeat protein [Flavobacteriaceae bacterium]
MNTQIEELNNEGVKFFLAGKFKDAKKKYEEALKMNPEYATTLNNIGMCFLQERDYVKAQKYFTNAINKKETATYVLNLGHALANQGLLKEAEENYIKSIQLNSNSIMAFKSLGSLYQKQQRFPESIKVWEQVIRNLSADSIFKIELAKDLIQLSEYQNALAVLFEAEKYEKNRAITWYYMALVHFHLKNFGLAEKTINRSIGLEPENLKFRALLAVIYLGFSDITNAIKQWDYILKFDENNLKIRIDKAVALLSNGFRDEALSELKVVLNKEANHPKALFYKALTLLEINKKDKEAIQLLKDLADETTEFSKVAQDFLTQLK